MNPTSKFFHMFMRRVRKGQYFHHPYLGNREFPAHFESVDSFPPCPAELQGTKDLGLMLHDIHFTQITSTKFVEDVAPYFYNAIMKDGVITVPEISKPE